MLKKWILAILAIIVVTTPLISSAQTLEKKKLTIAVGGKSLFYYLPLTIAERQGYFKDEGLEVEIPDFAGGAKALQALVGGSADMVSGAFEHTINMQAKKQPIRAVVLQANYSSIALVMPKDKAAKYKSGKDLKGLKIGVTAPGSSTNMFVNNLLAKDGLKPNEVAIVGVGAGAGAVAAMDKGEIDAVSNLDPVITQLESTGKFVAVADSRTEKGMKDYYGGDYLASCIYANEDFCEKKSAHHAGGGERHRARQSLDRQSHARTNHGGGAGRVHGRQPLDLQGGTIEKHGRLFGRWADEHEGRAKCVRRVKTVRAFGDRGGRINQPRGDV